MTDILPTYLPGTSYLAGINSGLTRQKEKMDAYQSTGGMSASYTDLDNPGALIRREMQLTNNISQVARNQEKMKELEQKAKQFNRLEDIAAKLALHADVTDKPYIDVTFHDQIQIWLDEVTSILNEADPNGRVLMAGSDTGGHASKDLIDTSQVPSPATGDLPNANYFLGNNDPSTVRFSASYKVSLQASGDNFGIQELILALKLAQNVQIEPKDLTRFGKIIEWASKAAEDLNNTELKINTYRQEMLKFTHEYLPENIRTDQTAIRDLAFPITITDAFRQVSELRATRSLSEAARTRDLKDLMELASLIG